MAITPSSAQAQTTYTFPAELAKCPSCTQYPQKVVNFAQLAGKVPYSELAGDSPASKQAAQEAYNLFKSGAKSTGTWSAGTTAETTAARSTVGQIARIGMRSAGINLLRAAPLTSGIPPLAVGLAVTGTVLIGIEYGDDIYHWIVGSPSVATITNYGSAEWVLKAPKTGVEQTVNTCPLLDDWCFVMQSTLQPGSQVDGHDVAGRVVNFGGWDMEPSLGWPENVPGWDKGQVIQFPQSQFYGSGENIRWPFGSGERYADFGTITQVIQSVDSSVYRITPSNNTPEADFPGEHHYTIDDQTPQSCGTVQQCIDLIWPTLAESPKAQEFIEHTNNPEAPNPIDVEPPTPPSAILPECGGITGTQCKAMVESAGFTDVIVDQASFEDADVEKGSHEFLRYVGRTAGESVVKTSTITIVENPATVPALVPAPQPGEDWMDYVQRLTNIGLDHALQPRTETDADPTKGPFDVVEVRPQPGTRARPGTDTITVVHNPATVPEPGTWTAPGLDTIDLTPLTNLGLGCGKFPFGIFCWMGDALGGWDTGESCPTWTLPFHSGDLKVDLCQFEPAMDIIRPVIIIAGTLLAAWFFAAAAMGLSGGGNDD